MIKKFQKPITTVYIRSLEATKNLNFAIVNEDIAGGIIEFNVGMSFWSFGEKFIITLTSLEQNQTQVEVSSKGSVGIQVYDWGKNEDNIKAFFRELATLLTK